MNILYKESFPYLIINKNKNVKKKEKEKFENEFFQIKLKK